MNFQEKLIRGTLIRLYKRFLADIKLNNGHIVTAHCTNSGSMKSCLEVNAPVLLSKSSNPNRKTRYTWEMIYMNNVWIGVNTLIPNTLVYESLKENSIPQLTGYTNIHREAKVKDSRIDFFLSNEFNSCYIEVKNVSMKDGKYAKFPDSITLRGKKHLEALINLKKQGHRSVMIYIIQREDICHFAPAWNIDHAYAEKLLDAYNSGVEIIPLMASLGPDGIIIKKEIPFDLKEKNEITTFTK